MERIPYDEFGYFADNAAEFGLPWDGPPAVRREFVEVRPGCRLSALVWGTAAPEIVLLHGGAQNAHTWDTVALALRRPLVAIDLPGHGHSDAGALAGGGTPSVDDLAADVAGAVAGLAPGAAGVVGMSLGGLTALALSRRAPELVRRLALVDVLPSLDPRGTAAISAFIQGPESFASFDEILARTMAHNPTRSESSLRRGILHNAVQREDGSWVWRYARHRDGGLAAEPRARSDGGGERFEALWEAVSALTVPLMLVRGTAAGSVVSDDAEKELLARRPDARVEPVAGAGHSVQGDRPVELADLIQSFIP